VVDASTKSGARTGLVLTTLAAAQFLMLLDSSVMNVAIATVAKDVGTTVTGIQTAITMYTLIMAMFMVTGGKLESMYGRKRIFMIGCIVYGLGSLTTALAPNLPILMETGVRILPLSFALLAGAVGVPRFFPRASPRRVVRPG
jgi:MFS family permease